MSNEEYEDDELAEIREDIKTKTWAGTGIKFLSFILFVLVVMLFVYALFSKHFFPYQTQAEFLFTYAPLPLIAYGIGSICSLLGKINSKL